MKYKAAFGWEKGMKRQCLIRPLRQRLKRRLRNIASCTEGNRRRERGKGLRFWWQRQCQGFSKELLVFRTQRRWWRHDQRGSLGRRVSGTHLRAFRKSWFCPPAISSGKIFIWAKTCCARSCEREAGWAWAGSPLIPFSTPCVPGLALLFVSRKGILRGIFSYESRIPPWSRRDCGSCSAWGSLAPPGGGLPQTRCNPTLACSSSRSSPLAAPLSGTPEYRIAVMVARNEGRNEEDVITDLQISVRSIRWRLPGSEIRNFKIWLNSRRDINMLGTVDTW